MSTIEEKIQKRLRSRKYFTCPVLHARIPKAECVTRQKRQPERTITRGGTFLLYNQPEDHFCRSGRCETGHKIKRELKGKKS